MPNTQNFLSKFFFLIIFIFASKELKADSKELQGSSFDKIENYLYQYYRGSFLSANSPSKILNHSGFHSNQLIKKINKHLKNSELHRWNYQQYLKTKKIPFKKKEKKELFLKLYYKGKLSANAQQYQSFFSSRKEDTQGKILSLLPYYERLKVSRFFFKKKDSFAYLLRFYLIGDYSLLANVLSNTKNPYLRVLRLCAWYKEQKWTNVYREYIRLRRLRSWNQVKNKLSYYRPNLSRSAMRYFYYAVLKVGKGRQYIAKIKKDYLNHPNIYFLQVLTKYYNRYENLELKNIIKKEFSGRYKYSYPASLYHWNIIHNFLRKKLWTNSTKENYYQNNISQKNKSSKKTKIPQQYPFDIFDSIHILLPNKKYLIDGVFQVTEKRSRRLFLQQNKDKKFLEHFDEKGNLQQYRVKNIYRIDNKNREIKKHLEKIQIIYDYFDTDVAKSILPKSQYHLKILENKTGNYYRYQKLYGEKKKMKDMKKDELRQIFPVPFPSVMNYYSKRYSIDPRLILSILKAESSFVETAISHSGALGLGQIMPRTGREIYNKSQVRYFSEMDLINPNQNIHFAYRYFSWLMKKYRGNYLQAICAYNGGPTSVDRWLKKYDFKNDLQFALTISFWQTYNYAQKVLRYYAYYLELYP